MERRNVLLLSELDAVSRDAVQWLVTRPVATHGRTASWDLTGFDDDGRALFSECFHLECPFDRGGTVWVEYFAIHHDVILGGAWEKTTPAGSWIISATTNLGSPPPRPASSNKRHARFRRS